MSMSRIPSACSFVDTVPATGLNTCVINSPIGPLTAVASECALVSLDFGNKTAANSERVAPGDHAMLRHTCEQLREYFAGTRRQFELPLAPPDRPFGRLAWEALLAIPYGQTRSYAQQAVAIGRPTATRAVARANGANRIAIIIPCHRVIGSNGSLTGFGGGLAIKRWLIDHEAETLWGQAPVSVDG